MKPIYSIFSMTEGSDINNTIKMRTTPRKSFNQANLYIQTGSSGIHSHKHKHIQLLVVFFFFFSSRLRDTNNMELDLLNPSLPDLHVGIYKKKGVTSENPSEATAGFLSWRTVDIKSVLCPSFKSYVCAKKHEDWLSFPPVPILNKYKLYYI